MVDLESHWLAERLAFLGRFLMGDAVWKCEIEVALLKLASNPKAEGCHRPKGVGLLLSKYHKALHKLPQKKLYQELVVGTTSACHWRRFTPNRIGCQVQAS